MALVTLYSNKGNPVCTCENTVGWLSTAKYHPINTRLQMHQVLRVDNLDVPQFTGLWAKPEDVPVV